MLQRPEKPRESMSHQGRTEKLIRGDETEVGIEKNTSFLWNPWQNVPKGGAKDRRPPPLYAYVSHATGYWRHERIERMTREVEGRSNNSRALFLYSLTNKKSIHIKIWTSHYLLAFVHATINDGSTGNRLAMEMLRISKVYKWSLFVFYLLNNGAVIFKVTWTSWMVMPTSAISGLVILYNWVGRVEQARTGSILNVKTSALIGA